MKAKLKFGTYYRSLDNFTPLIYACNES